MAYFSFIINDTNVLKYIKGFGEFDLKVKYYSKNSKLRSFLNKLYKKNLNINLKSEIRIRAKKNFSSVLFCLPPNIGLGDTIEYALAIKSIILNKNYKKVGVAHVGKYTDVFRKLFEIDNVYDFVSEDILKIFDTAFHFTLEINQLLLQKYNRQNIEKLITDFFEVNLYRKKFKKNNEKKIIDTISIFPVSNSPIRTLPIFVINYIIELLIKKYKIEIYLDNSIISQYIFSNIIKKQNLFFYYPENYQSLIKKIQNIQFGIFPDSGPLHVAKIFNKKGILFISSVDKKILLNNFNSIQSIDSGYKSNYCNGPCGLVNAFNYNDNYGCYDSLLMKKDQILKNQNLKKLQRGNLIDNYLQLYISSTNCYKHFNNKKIKLFIEKELNP